MGLVLATILSFQIITFTSNLQEDNILENPLIPEAFGHIEPSLLTPTSEQYIVSADILSAKFYIKDKVKSLNPISNYGIYYQMYEPLHDDNKVESKIHKVRGELSSFGTQGNERIPVVWKFNGKWADSKMSDRIENWSDKQRENLMNKGKLEKYYGVSWTPISGETQYLHQPTCDPFLYLSIVTMGWQYRGDMPDPNETIKGYLAKQVIGELGNLLKGKIEGKVLEKILR